MSYIDTVLMIIMVCVGGYTGYRLYKSPIKIEFKVSILNILQLAFSMFASITCVMAFELILNQVQLEQWKSATGFLKLLRELLNAGVGIAILLPLLSILFGKWVRKFDLDLSDEYSENAVKVYYSLVILLNCVFYLCMMGKNIMDGTAESQNIFGRVMVWLLNVFGTWVGIGFHCKGRIDEEIENIILSKKKEKSVEAKKRIIMHMVLYGSVFIFCGILLLLPLIAPDVYNGLVKSISIVVYSFAISMFFVAIIGICCTCPSVKHSDRILAKTVNKINNSGLESIKDRYRYGRLQYAFVILEGEKYIKVYKREVYWKGHEKEIKDVFGEIDLPVDDFEYKSCKKCLTNVLENQRDFIKKNNVVCKKEKEKELIESRTKNFG